MAAEVWIRKGAEAFSAYNIENELLSYLDGKFSFIISILIIELNNYFILFWISGNKNGILIPKAR